MLDRRRVACFFPLGYVAALGRGVSMLSSASQLAALVNKALSGRICGCSGLWDRDTFVLVTVSQLLLLSTSAQDSASMVLPSRLGE